MARKRPPLPPLKDDWASGWPQELPDGHLLPDLPGHRNISDVALRLADTGEPLAAWAGRAPCPCLGVRLVAVIVAGDSATALAHCPSCSYTGQLTASISELRRHGRAWQGVTDGRDRNRCRG